VVVSANFVLTEKMPEPPVITIFVRHSAACRYRDDETWKRCDCRKHLRWSLNGKQYRRSAKTRSWSGAEEERRRIEKGFASEGTVPAENAAPKTIKDAVDTFVASKQSQGVGIDISDKYKRELGRLETFMASRGKCFPRQITLDDLIAFRAGWQQLYPSSLTRQKAQERLRAFLRYCHDAGHVDRIPRLSPIKAEEPPTIPLTEAEYKKILDTIPTEFPDPKRAARMKGLVQLMRHSGLAIRDAATLERNAIQFDQKKKVYRIVTRRQKTGTHVSVVLPTEIAKELLEVTNGNAKYVFWNSGVGLKRTVATHWGDDVRKLMRAAGLPKGHSHQLRDTFAVHLLSNGVPLEEVSKLLGHESIKTTEKYYAKWVPSRQDRLDNLVMATFTSKPA
jgi:integrase/recombinase XerD